MYTRVISASGFRFGLEFFQQRETETVTPWVYTHAYIIMYIGLQTHTSTYNIHVGLINKCMHANDVLVLAYTNAHIHIYIHV